MQPTLNPIFAYLYFLLKDRENVETKIADLIATKKAQLSDLSGDAETFDFEKLALDKIEHCNKTQQYFLQKLAADDMKTVLKIIASNCLPDDNGIDQIPIYGVFSAEYYGYTIYAQSKNMEMIMQTFKEDKAFLEDGKQEARKISDKIKPQYDAQINRACKSYGEIIQELRKPL